MKIAIVTPMIASSADVRFYASQHLHIANELVGRGARVDIYTLNRGSDGYREERLSLANGGIGIYSFPRMLPVVTGRLVPNMAPMKGLGGSLKAKDYDIVQVSEDISPSSFQAALRCNGARLVIFQGINSYSARAGRRAAMRLVDAALGGVLRRRADLVVAKTSQAEGFMRAKGYGKAVTIPMGVDAAHFRPRGRDEAKEYLAGKGVGGHAITALYAGNLIPRRDLGVVLKAVRAVRRKGHDLCLVLVGRGSERERLESTASELGIRKAAYFIEPVPNLEMPLVYSAADVFVFAPLYEIFGMVVLEAMACGLPVVSTPVPAVADILSENPRGGMLTFGYSSDKELAERLLALAQDPAVMTAMGMESRRAAIGYSWQRIGRRIFDEYSKLL